tara:strand:+ start:5103 stop:5570 length:468 start_codon:yes stop_codon:yes gene_type:complete
MKSNKKYYFGILFFLNLFPFLTFAEDGNKNFLSLRNDEVNLRQGPSFEYPVKLIYKKKYLPVVIIDKSETWRQIKDFENNSGWIHISQLSKKKSAINTKNNSIIYNKASIYSKPIARLEIGRLVLVKKCKVKWCKIVSGNFNGWILESYLWGKIN